MIKNSSTLPAKLRRAPGRLKEIVNGIIDFCQRNRVSVGYGLKVEETINGKVISVSKTLEDLAKTVEVDPSAIAPSTPVPTDDYITVDICVNGTMKKAYLRGYIADA